VGARCKDVCADHIGGRVDDQDRHPGKPLSANAAAEEQP
jgi:hypothetical protein